MTRPTARNAASVQGGFVQENAATPDQLYPDDPFGGVKEPATDPSPVPQVVNAFHKRSDKDSSVSAQHHTLGPGHNQSSPGDHKHDGTSSKRLMDGIIISGSKGGNVALGNLIAALVPILGFTDNTT